MGGTAEERDKGSEQIEEEISNHENNSLAKRKGKCELIPKI